MVTLAPSPLDKLAPDGCACYGDTGYCVCPDTQRALNFIAAGNAPMSDEQREWCRKEIGQVEGYSREDYDASDDRGLAHGVLCAWVDYARDKGLL